MDDDTFPAALRDLALLILTIACLIVIGVALLA